MSSLSFSPSHTLVTILQHRCNPATVTNPQQCDNFATPVWQVRYSDIYITVCNSATTLLQLRIILNTGQHCLQLRGVRNIVANENHSQHWKPPTQFSNSDCPFRSFLGTILKSLKKGVDISLIK